MPALAYFITWTCYGTWLHGDKRGSVDDSHNRYGMPYLPENSARKDRVLHELAESPWVMSDADRADICAAIGHTAQVRAWHIHELNVRTNHVHVVVRAFGEEPEHVAGIFKTWATRALSPLDVIKGAPSSGRIRRAPDMSSMTTRSLRHADTFSTSSK
jgi:hypothetical protein